MPKEAQVVIKDNFLSVDGATMKNNKMWWIGLNSSEQEIVIDHFLFWISFSIRLWFVVSRIKRLGGPPGENQSVTFLYPKVTQLNPLNSRCPRNVNSDVHGSLCVKLSIWIRCVVRRTLLNVYNGLLWQHECYFYVSLFKDGRRTTHGLITSAGS